MLIIKYKNKVGNNKGVAFPLMHFRGSVIASLLPTEMGFISCGS